MSKLVKYAARVQGVRELSLRGSADLEFWRSFFEPYGLAPREENGRACILITAANLRWAGLPFREIDVSVELVAPEDSPLSDAACLLQAFNTNRFFAFCERAFFYAPYASVPCEVSLEEPRGIRLGGAPGLAFHATLASLPNPLPPATPGGLFGPVIFLPKSPGAPPRHFIAHIDALTRTFPFLPDTDLMRIEPYGPGSDAFRQLIDSAFTPETWILREDAFHGKSPTYRGLPEHF